MTQVHYTEFEDKNLLKIFIFDTTKHTSANDAYNQEDITALFNEAIGFEYISEILDAVEGANQAANHFKNNIGFGVDIDNIGIRDYFDGCLSQD